MWMRLKDVRKDRECVIPDVSRTFHFGSSGINMNSYFQDVYFNKHSFNTEEDVELRDVERSVAYQGSKERVRKTCVSSRKGGTVNS